MRASLNCKNPSCIQDSHHTLNMYNIYILLYMRENSLLQMEADKIL